MGSAFSREGDLEQLYDFRKLSTEDLEFEIPEKPEHRRPTDQPWFFVFIAAFVILIPFLIYTLAYTELRQLTGSDNCGNFCGYKNKKYDQWACTGKDYTDEKYEFDFGTVEVLGHRLQKRMCVSSCPNNSKPTLHICPSTHNGHSSDQEFVSTLGDIGKDIARGWWAILLSTIISCSFSFSALLLFRHAVNFVVWFILIGCIVALTLLSGYFWYAFANTSDHQSQYNTSRDFLTPAIVSSIFVIFLVCLTTCMVKRIQLIIALFKEASKALFEIPSLILMPIYTSLLLTLMILGFILLNFFMLMAGKLTQIVPNYLTYSPDTGMIIALAYNLFFFVWVLQFVVDCQYFVLAGAVSSWFFTRNKHQLVAPVFTSFTNLIRFHLGTVALGSLILTVMNFVRAIIRSLAQNRRTKLLIDCCLGRIEYILKFLSNNAYIQSAMHGQPFLRSGRRAAKLLISNAINVLAVTSIGDFVLSVAMLLLILLSSGVGTLLAMATKVENYWAVAVVCAIIATCMSLIFFSVLKATVDCIFICFCEDTSLNDGMTRPYFMPKSLMQYFQHSQFHRVQ